VDPGVRPTRAPGAERTDGTGSTLLPAAVADYFGREQAARLAGLLFTLGGSMAAWGRWPPASSTTAPGPMSSPGGSGGFDALP
jgi:hypothetical protein